MKQRFSVRGSFLGEREAVPLKFHETIDYPNSVALFCATCGDIWARVETEGRGWRCIHSLCDKCAPLTNALLVDQWLEAFRGELPEGVWKWEGKRAAENFKEEEA